MENSLGHRAVRGRSRWLGGLVSICLALTLMFGSSGTAQAANFNWTGLAGDGDWTNTQNWSPNNRLPGNGDDVTIGADYTVTLPSGSSLQTIKSLSVLSGATLIVHSDLTIRESSSLGGSLSGTATVTVTAGTRTLTFTGGSLSGSLSIAANVNVSSGQVRPGGTGVAGTLTINGNYTQGSSATLNIELGGSSVYDRLNVTGTGTTATLNGNLLVSTIGGFVPDGIVSFLIVSFPSRNGQFAAELGLPSQYSVDYGASAVTLQPNQTNNPPTADANGPYSVLAGSSVTLSGSGSDPDFGDILSYAWDLDDNGTYETLGQSVLFSAVGRTPDTSQTVILRVCDNHEACDTSSATVSILNNLPTANAGRPYSVMAGGSVTLDGSASSDPDGDSLEYSWNLGSGFGSFGPSSTVSFSAVGLSAGDSRTVQLQVRDSHGGVSAPASATVNVIASPNQAPTANAGGPYTVETGGTVVLNGSGSDLDAGDTVDGYQWDFNGDGAADSTLQNPSFSAASITAGSSRTARLRVQDNHGLWGAWANATVNITTRTESPASGVTLTFNTVTSAGTPMATNTGSTLPDGASSPPGVPFAVAGDYYDLGSSTSFGGTVKVCLPYDPSRVPPLHSVKLLHYEGASWVDRTTLPVDTSSHVVCGTVSSLSPFVAASSSGGGTTPGTRAAGGIAERLAVKEEANVQTQAGPGYVLPTAGVVLLAAIGLIFARRRRAMRMS